MQYDCFWIYLITVAHWLYFYCLMSVKKLCSSMNSRFICFCFLFYGHFHLQVTYQFMELMWFTGSCKLSSRHSESKQSKHFQIEMHSNAFEIYSGIFFATEVVCHDVSPMRCACIYGQISSQPATGRLSFIYHLINIWKASLWWWVINFCNTECEYLTFLQKIVWNWHDVIICFFKLNL